MSYRVVDHCRGKQTKRYASRYEATIAAMKLARLQTIFNDKRIHLSVMDGRKQAIEINISQREEVR
ncbi:MAG: hypothetical protein ABF820_13515 [Sporolactobacillus sp.]